MSDKKNEKNKVTMKEIPLSERPYEKLDFLGAETLSDTELLAIIIKNGTKGRNSLEVARDIMLSADGAGGLNNIRQLSIEELTKIRGIGRIKALQIKALSEITKRLAATPVVKDKTTVKCAEDIIKMLMPQMQEYKREVVKVVLLNAKNRVIKISDVSVGSLSASIVHPREIYLEAVKCPAAAIIVCHNHPSGDAEPSREDIETTKRLSEAGTVLGIQLLDHIVFGAGSCKSILSMKTII